MGGRSNGAYVARWGPCHPSETTAIKRLMFAGLATLVVLLPGPSAVQAASCNGASHTPHLRKGTVSPSSAVAGSTFRFAVTYSDTANCEPTRIVVRIPGLGTYHLRASATNYVDGVRFSRKVRISAPGRYDYAFAVTSGSGGGEKSARLRSVTPATFKVTARPAPTPTPEPTPKPTIAPSPAPSPPPTKVATPVPATPSPTAKPTRKARSHKPTPSASPSEKGGAGQGSGETSPSPNAVAGHSSATPEPETVVAPFELDLPEGSLRVVEAALATAGGLALFLVLVPRRRRLAAVVAAAGSLGPPSSDADPPASGGSVLAADDASAAVLPDEATLPRWLRPSVQEARYGRRRID
jgi:hypothetical protein